MADVLKPLMRGIRPAKKDMTEEIRSVWAQVVGSAASKKSRVAGFRDGELVIDVSSSALRQHLSVFRREEILTALRQHLPEIRLDSLKCRVSGGF